MVVFLVFVGFQISLFFVALVGLFSDGMVFSGSATSVVCLGVYVGAGYFVSCIIVLANCFALFGSLIATWRARISSSVSIVSSAIVSKVVVGAVVVFVVILVIGGVSFPIPPAVRLTLS
jgi:hypothetical protein